MKVIVKSEQKSGAIIFSGGTGSRPSLNLGLSGR